MTMTIKLTRVLAPALSALFALASNALMAATPRTLLVGVFGSASGADKAFAELKEAQKTKVISIDSFAVVSKDDKGRISVHDTQQRNSGWGAVAGGVLGAIVMGPIGAVAGAGAGGLTGWLTGRSVGIPPDDISNIKAALTPNSSAVIAIVDNKWVADVERALRKEATKAFIRDQLADQEMPSAAH